MLSEKLSDPSEILFETRATDSWNSLTTFALIATVRTLLEGAASSKGFVIYPCFFFSGRPQHATTIWQRRVLRGKILI
jgi:hypothetical protein